MTDDTPLQTQASLSNAYRAPSHKQLMQHDPVLGYRFLPGLKIRVEHEGGGYLMGLASHDIDFLLWLFGAPEAWNERIAALGAQVAGGDRAFPAAERRRGVHPRIAFRAAPRGRVWRSPVARFSPASSVR